MSSSQSSGRFSATITAAMSGGDSFSSCRRAE
jgi:hypothetical protein